VQLVFIYPIDALQKVKEIIPDTLVRLLHMCVCGNSRLNAQPDSLTGKQCLHNKGGMCLCLLFVWRHGFTSSGGVSGGTSIPPTSCFGGISLETGSQRISFVPSGTQEFKEFFDKH